jgi:glutamine amidotransferase
MIAIVDYGLGNVRAFANVYKRFDVPFVVASKPEDLARADRIILPGVGAFDEAMRLLDASGLRGPLAEAALGRKLPLLGICVGMQILARSSEEGTREGLGWIGGVVRKMDPAGLPHRTGLPHMGWNGIRVARPDPLLEGLGEGARFYFLHSYRFGCDREEDVLAVSEYGAPFPSAVRAGNVAGIQFHPEKSHRDGERVLRNFAAAG